MQSDSLVAKKYELSKNICLLVVTWLDNRESKQGSMFCN